MKVQGPGPTQGASKTQKKSGVSGSDSAFGDMLSTGDAAQASPTHAATTIAALDTLLAVQGAEDPAAKAAKRRMRERSDTILQGLDKIRLAMLSGNLTVGDMIDMADVVASHREKISDPALTAIMDEIDLRAQVELAKMRVALDAGD